MKLPSAPLEDWLRDNYFNATIDISSSGVQPYSMAELRKLAGVGTDEIDDLVFDDGYSLGTPAVREVIAARWGDGDPARVMTANGSSEAITLILTALLRPGDEVVVVRPGYHSLIYYAEALGATTRDWRLDPDLSWKPSLDALADLVTERTRAIIVNFPQNPTGVSMTEPDMMRVVEEARRVGAYLLWDAAFADLTYAKSLPDISTRYERGISFGTFSKAFGLPGLRFGWCLAPADVLDACVRIRDYTTLHVSPLNELLALGVLRNAEAFLEPRMSQARRGREIVREWAETVSDRLTLTLPDGGVAAFPRLDEHADTYSLCDDLFQRYGVLVVPGSCFEAPRHLRLGFGGPADQLAEGLDRVTTVLKTWS